MEVTLSENQTDRINRLITIAAWKEWFAAMSIWSHGLTKWLHCQWSAGLFMILQTIKFCIVLYCEFIWPSTFNIIINYNANISNGHIFTIKNPLKVILRNLWLGQNIKQSIDAKRIHHQLVPMRVDYERGLDQVWQFYYLCTCIGVFHIPYVQCIIFVHLGF